MVIQRMSLAKMYKVIQNIHRRINTMMVVVKQNESGDGANGGHSSADGTPGLAGRPTLSLVE